MPATVTQKSDFKQVAPCSKMTAYGPQCRPRHVIVRGRHAQPGVSIDILVRPTPAA